MARRAIDLNGACWRLGQAPADASPEHACWAELARVAEWLPALVPGNVHADLIRLGRLPDLTVGRGPDAAQWVDDSSWWLTRDFELAITGQERAHLLFAGIDYISDLFLNGEHLGRHEGMFSAQWHEVTGLVQAENRLAIRLLGSRWLPNNRSSRWVKLLNRIEAAASKMPGRFPDRRDTLKCQMSFGWDFAPPLRTVGIWDDASVVITPGLFLRDVIARTEVSAGGATLHVQVEIDSDCAQPARLQCILRGETFDSEPVVAAATEPIEALPGTKWHALDLAVSHPRLWWPWDHGAPDLYQLVVELWQGAALVDSVTKLVGLRQVAWENWGLQINGRPVYARGANWVPADLLPGRVTKSDYAALLDQVRHANMNMLRVWGGGLREKRAFYDLCDRLGIVVWQEFPFACAFLTRFPHSEEYLRLAEAEVGAIVRELRNHASIVLWCGGNEFSSKRNSPLVAALQRAVAAEDPSRPFLPASPATGDSHFWGVWHELRPPSAYRQDRAPFASEFGLQAVPGEESLRRFVPAAEIWPPGPSWVSHGADLQKLGRYARPFLSEKDSSLASFVEATQRAQAYGLQIAIEHYRRQKAAGARGILVWQFNEPWPAISWALVDYYGQPKAACETVRRLFHPILISIEYALQRYEAGDRLAAEVWAINDTPQAFPGCRVEVALQDGNGAVLRCFTGEVDLPSDSAVRVGDLNLEMPAWSGWTLTCQIMQNGQVLSANRYDLTVHDGIQPTMKQRAWAWFSGLVIPK